MRRIIAAVALVLLLVLSPLAYGQEVDPETVESIEVMCRSYQGLATEVHESAEMGISLPTLLKVFQEYSIDRLIKKQDDERALSSLKLTLPRMRNVMIFAYMARKTLSLEEITTEVYVSCTTYFLEPVINPSPLPLFNNEEKA